MYMHCSAKDSVDWAKFLCPKKQMSKKKFQDYEKILKKNAKEYK